MTKEEVIKELRYLYTCGVSCIKRPQTEALAMAIATLQEEPVSKDLGDYINKLSKQFPEVSFAKLSRISVRVAKWQEKQDQETIELAEDHAYFAGRTKTIDEIKEALLSEVLPCFMHGGEADEVVAKLDEVLNKKK